MTSYTCDHATKSRFGPLRAQFSSNLEYVYILINLQAYSRPYFYINMPYFSAHVGAI